MIITKKLIKIGKNSIGIIIDPFVRKALGLEAGKEYNIDFEAMFSSKPNQTIKETTNPTNPTNQEPEKKKPVVFVDGEWMDKAEYDKRWEIPQRTPENTINLDVDFEKHEEETRKANKELKEW